jgi:hypothetical protein
MLVICSLLAGCATRPEANANADAWNNEIEALDTGLTKGQITPLEHAKQIAKLAKQYNPQDYSFQSFMNYRVLLQSRLDRGDIKQDEFDYLWAEKGNSYLAEKQRAAHEDAAQNDERRRRAVATFANGMSNSIRQATPPVTAPIRCTSTQGVGASISTTCY